MTTNTPDVSYGGGMERSEEGCDKIGYCCFKPAA